MSFTEGVLRTRQAKEAIGEGISVFLTTGNLDKGINAMIQYGKRNGTYTAFRLALVLDFLDQVFQ